MVGKVHCCLKDWTPPVGGCGESSGALQDTAPSLFSGPPRSQAGPRQCELEGPEEKARICLLPHSPPDDHHGWLNGTTNGRWLTDGCLWEGHSVNQWLNRTTNGHSMAVSPLGEGPTSTDQWLNRTANFPRLEEVGQNAAQPHTGLCSATLPAHYPS